MINFNGTHMDSIASTATFLVLIKKYETNKGISSFTFASLDLKITQEVVGK